jgi:hypothetical protein
MNEKRLDAEILQAHAAGVAARLARLYRDAADRAEAAGETDRAGFYLTHAWVFALEAGDPLADEIRARLVRQGRETER